MEEIVIPMVALLSIFVGLPWLILHYVTRWKTAATLTTDDEAMLEELYQLARRLSDRIDTVERLVAADNPQFQPARLVRESQQDEAELPEIERFRALRGRKAR
ncbi:MAG: envelope stress response membrane protein PspB [Novosphingobium sp.]